MTKTHQIAFAIINQNIALELGILTIPAHWKKDDILAFLKSEFPALALLPGTSYAFNSPNGA